MQKLIFINSRGQSVEFGNSGPFVLQKFDPNPPKTTILNSKAPGQDGKSYEGTLLEETILLLEVAIIGESSEDMFKRRQELYSILNPKLMGTLIYKNDWGEHKIQCVVQDGPTPKSRVDPVQEFLIQLYCPMPFWINLQESKEEVALWTGDFEFDLEITEGGIQLGHRQSNLIVNIFNSGDVECGMRIEFRALATVVNPSLFDVNTREYIKVKRSLQEGDKLFINTSFASKRVELINSNGINQNAFNYIDLNSTFLQLAPGDNLLRYDAEQGIDNLEVSIYYNPCYLGV